MKKSDIINEAYSKLKISGITTNPKAEYTARALSRLESMMHELRLTLDLGYNFSTPLNPDHLTNVPDWAKGMISDRLAIRLVPDFGKLVPQELHTQAVISMNAVTAKVAMDLMQETSSPSGYPFGNNESSSGLRRSFHHNISIPNDNDKLIKKGMVDDFSESFASYLKELETISSSEVAANEKPITIVSSTNTASLVDYRVKAESIGGSKVTIKITTSAGRVEIRGFDFEVVA